MQCFLLLRPRLLAIKNVLLLNRKAGKSSQRELIFAIVSLILVTFVYQASVATFMTVKSSAPAYGLPPEIVIALFFSLLSGMIFLSASVSALGSFYLGNDLDFLMSRPISSTQFLIGKGLETTFQSSWMVVVFGMPSLIGLGVVYEMPIAYHALSVLALLPVLTIPTFLGITLISLIIRIIPPQKTREFLFVAASVLILYIYLTAKNFLVTSPIGAPTQLSESMHQLITFSSSPFLPSSWAASLLGEFIRAPQLTKTVCVLLVALYLVALSMGLIALFVVKQLHFDAFSRSRSGSSATKVYNKRGGEILQRYLFFVPQSFRSLWAKEMKLFGRDLTQGLQLVMLLGICLIYLYNFRIIHQVNNMRPEVLLWWRGTLLICNLAMGAFIITAVNSRFVFPSLSIEGSAFWVIRAAPLSIRSILHAKFWIWYIPIGIISDIVLVSGALAIDAEPIVILITAIFSWILCFGLVGLGIGLGSFFAHFDWENIPQISASFGNFVYMLAGTLLVFLNLIPVMLITVLAIMRQSGINLAPSHWYFAIVSATLIVLYINYAAYRFSFKLGEEALLQKT